MSKSKLATVVLGVAVIAWWVLQTRSGVRPPWAPGASPTPITVAMPVMTGNAVKLVLATVTPVPCVTPAAMLATAMTYCK